MSTGRFTPEALPGGSQTAARRDGPLPRALVAVVSNLVEQYSGLSLGGVHGRGLEQGIRRRIQATGTAGIREYLALLQSHQTDELQRLIEAVTNPETTFFRNRAHFRSLREVVLPSLAVTDAPVCLWSAGCSTGEEPYSLAIACLDAGLTHGGRPVSILATDISRLALDAARRGEYSERRLQHLPPSLRARYFERRGERWRVRDEVRALVTFLRHNLIEPDLPAPAGTVDVLFCQNVLIYFRPELVGRIAARLATALRDGGYLYPGFSETAWYRVPTLESVRLGDCFLYRKVPAAADREAPAVEPEPRPPIRRPDSAALPRAVTLPSPPAPRAGDALAEAERAVAAEPLSSEAWERLGLLCRQARRTGEAESAFRRLLYLRPDSPLAHFHLGALFRETGRAAEARREYAKAERLLRALPPGAPLGGVTAGLLLDACRRALSQTGE